MVVGTSRCMLVCTEENLVLYLAVLSVEAKQRLNHF